jgi:NAD(P)-dependent dehydrogenase (short-subunit alcohol dehydrogenase family)
VTSTAGAGATHGGAALRPACVIVGVGPGLSQAVAERFAREGYAIGLVTRTQATLDAAAAKLGAAGATVATAAGNGGDAASLRGALDAIAARLGPPAVAIYNASVLRMARPSALAPEALAEDFAIDVAGALVLAQHVLPGMRARGRGTILLTGGATAFEPWVDAASLGIGKAGIRNLALALARELAPEGIHAGTVTICGAIAAGTFYDPQRIAGTFWDFHRDPPSRFREEIVYREG